MNTFLKDTAYAWLTNIVPYLAPNGTTWKELRKLFITCYLGDADRISLRRKLDRAMQKEGETAATFIPRVLHLIKALNQDEREIVATQEIIQKLRPEVQEKLVLFKLRTIQHLYDACSKIEAGIAAAKAAA